MLKVLIIDDEPDLCDLLVEFIKSNFDSEVDVCHDLATAFLKIRINQYDLLLVDIRMGGASGITLLKTFNDNGIKNKPKNIWFMSGYISDEQMKTFKGVQNEKIEVFQKPFNFETLKNKLLKLIDQ